MQQSVPRRRFVPLFVEELTKTVVESGYSPPSMTTMSLSGPLPPLAIPATLQDSHGPRLDRLSTVRGDRPTGCDPRREFSYELIHAVSPLDEESYNTGLNSKGGGAGYQRGWCRKPTISSSMPSFRTRPIKRC